MNYKNLNIANLHISLETLIAAKNVHGKPVALPGKNYRLPSARLWGVWRASGRLCRKETRA
jgi:hypothetical protein